MANTNQNHLWDVLGLFGVGVVVVTIASLEFWKALYQIIMVIAALAVVVAIGVAVAAPVFRAFAMFRKPLPKTLGPTPIEVESYKTSFKQKFGVAPTLSEVQMFIHGYPEWHNKFPK